MNATTIRSIVNAEIAKSKSDLGTANIERTRVWASKWEADWSRDRSVNARAVRVMTRNFISHAIAHYGNNPPA